MSIDVLRQRRQVVDARRRFDGLRLVSSDVVAPGVGESWQRCASTLPIELGAPIALVDHDERWEASAIRRAAPAIVDELSHLALSEDYIAAITDDDGHILWSAAGRSMAGRAEQVNFVRGANWNESVAGTNAPGLALRTGRPSAVFAAEHWSTSVQEWVCYAAPVHGPSGDVVGVLDLSTLWRSASPFALTTVTAMARLIEQQLVADPIAAGLGPRAPLELRVLGEPTAVVNGRAVKLSQRQFEILAILGHRGSCRLDELHDLLYGDRPVSTSTLKAEISHLRQALGGTIASRPYRIDLGLDLDVTRVLDALAGTEPLDAIDDYRGQLLPFSESPYLAELRHRVDVAMRAAVLRSADVQAVRRYVDVNPYDLAVIEHGLSLASPGEPAHELFRARRAAASD